MEKGKVLIIDDLHPIIIEMFNNSGFKCDNFPRINKKDIINIIDNYEILILRSKIIVDKTIIDKAEKLKFIGRAGSGLENIDLEYAKSKKIKVFNSPKGNSDSVAEHTIGLLLCLLNKIIISSIQVKNGIWQRNINWGTELKGKTVAIIGYGNMGMAFAKRLVGFDVNVIAYDKYKNNFSDSFVKECELDDIFEKSDIVSFHIPYNDETKYLVDNEFIGKFKKEIILINTSRGKIVKTQSLVDNIENGKLIGVLLDVIEYENFTFEKIGCINLSSDFQKLISFDNVVLTPHIAGWSAESYFKISFILADKILSAINSEGKL